jgi:hypothetical protein
MCRLKIKPCMIYIVMRLIPWKQTCRSKTVESRSLLTQSTLGSHSVLTQLTENETPCQLSDC